MELFNKLIRPILILKNWWLYFLDYFRLTHTKNIIYFLRNGYVFMGNPGKGDGLIINEIWGNHIYTPAGFEIKPTDIVVDIGAHKGYFTIFASQFITSGKIFSFEPLKSNFAMIKKNLVLNDVTSVQPMPYAVTGKKEQRYLYVSTQNAGGMSMIKEWFHQTQIQSYKVACIQLKDIFTQCDIKKIDFLKIDCEGAEYEILLNTPKNVMNKISKISMEYHQIGELKVENIINFLQKNNFKTSTIRQNDSLGLLYAQKI